MSEGTTRRTALTVGLALPVLAACGDDSTDPGAGGTTSAPASNGAPSTPASSAPAQGIASTADIPVGGGAIIDDLVITQPSEGEFKAFSAICTHQGCTVGGVSDTIDCNCHGSKFSITDGANVQGPSGQPAGSINPLGSRQIRVEGDQIFQV